LVPIAAPFSVSQPGYRVALDAGAVATVRWEQI